MRLELAQARALNAECGLLPVLHEPRNGEVMKEDHFVLNLGHGTMPRETLPKKADLIADL